MVQKTPIMKNHTGAGAGLFADLKLSFEGFGSWTELIRADGDIHLLVFGNTLFRVFDEPLEPVGIFGISHDSHKIHETAVEP